MARPRFVERTIRDGKIIINGVTFAPQSRHMAYDGRLDGMRYLFGLYYDTDWKRDLVALWGQKGAAEWERASAPDVVNGLLPWLWWEPRHD